MALNSRIASWITVAGILLTVTDVLVAQTELGNWQEITAIPDAKTHLVPRTWTLDKYPDAPTLKPNSKVTILDQEGPGVVTNFHVSNYAGGEASQLHLRVWYDREDTPAIDMPLMDFLGDVQAAAKPYHTIYSSIVAGWTGFGKRKSAMFSMTRVRLVVLLLIACNSRIGRRMPTTTCRGNAAADAIRQWQDRTKIDILDLRGAEFTRPTAC